MGTTKQVRAFLNQAAKGCHCTYFEEGERIPMKYCIDEQLENLLIVSNQDKPQTGVICPMIAIQDIYLIDDGKDFIPSEVISNLHPSEIDRFFMVVYENGEDELSNICILDSSKIMRDICLECLKILSVGALLEVSH